VEGIERIKVLASEVKDEAVLEIVKYLISRTDMNDKYLNEEKSLKQMIDFILKEAKKKSENNMAMIKDDVVFGWAIHYWDEDNKDLDLSSSDNVKNIGKKEKVVQEKTNKIVKKDWTPEGQLTLF
jgi:hypothetical protein